MKPAGLSPVFYHIFARHGIIDRGRDLRAKAFTVKVGHSSRRFFNMSNIYLKAVKTAVLLAIEGREIAKPSGMTKTPAKTDNASKTEPQGLSPSALPTTAETLEELRRRLGKELYQMEWDLKGGARIAGKPCDCLGSKHNLGLEAVAEELMSYERNPVYSEILNWLKSHQAKFPVEVIAQTEPDYYRGLAPEVRDFRKRVMGTEKLSALRASATSLSH